jgi:antitoxin CptB
MQNGITQVESRRLAWRCRRGMLELDIVLQRFVLKHVNSLTAAEMEAFDALLELPDNEFWSKLQGKNTDENNIVQQAVLDKLNEITAL